MKYIKKIFILQLLCLITQPLVYSMNVPKLERMKLMKNELRKAIELGNVQNVAQVLRLANIKLSPQEVIQVFIFEDGETVYTLIGKLKDEKCSMQIASMLINFLITRIALDRRDLQNPYQAAVQLFYNNLLCRCNNSHGENLLSMALKNKKNGIVKYLLQLLSQGSIKLVREDQILLQKYRDTLLNIFSEYINFLKKYYDTTDIDKLTELNSEFNYVIAPIISNVNQFIFFSNHIHRLSLFLINNDLFDKAFYTCLKDYEDFMQKGHLYFLPKEQKVIEAFDANLRQSVQSGLQHNRVDADGLFEHLDQSAAELIKRNIACRSKKVREDKRIERSCRSKRRSLQETVPRKYQKDVRDRKDRGVPHTSLDESKSFQKKYKKMKKRSRRMFTPSPHEDEREDDGLMKKQGALQKESDEYFRRQNATRDSNNWVQKQLTSQIINREPWELWMGEVLKLAAKRISQRSISAQLNSSRSQKNRNFSDCIVKTKQ